MDIYFGIDGTGPSNNDEYRTDFTNSFVRKIWSTWAAGNAGYLRGPSLLGSETAGLAGEGTRWIVNRVRDLEKTKQPTRLFLSGYSRGGAAIVEVANQLKSQGIKVHCMMLFDAVDRSNLGSTDVIPSNVTLAYHAMRDPKAASREIFGNCATRAAGGVAYTSKTFFCTHGAMGGTPWTTAGEHGRIREVDGSQRTGARAVAGAVGRVIGGPLFGPMGERLGQAGADVVIETNVTLEQERAGSAAVWKWMSDNLTLARSQALAASNVPLAAAGRAFSV